MRSKAAMIPRVMKNPGEYSELRAVGSEYTIVEFELNPKTSAFSLM